jgi:hypothetical protein
LINVIMCQYANWLIGCAMFMLRHHALVIDTLAH